MARTNANETSGSPKAAWVRSVRLPPRAAALGEADNAADDDAAAAAPPPPAWAPTAEAVDLEGLIASDPAPPAFEETVDLWRDDLDPHSFGFFRVRVRVHAGFWVAYALPS